MVIVLIVIGVDQLEWYVHIARARAKRNQHSKSSRWKRKYWTSAGLHGILKKVTRSPRQTGSTGGYEPVWFNYPQLENLPRW